MEKLSRVRKYEDLRKQIENETVGTGELPQEKIQDYAERLNEIDPSIFKKVNISEEAAYTPERERKLTSSTYDNDMSMSDFRNEYLDDFINEVREYNIKKGNRENENTQIDILNQLNAVSRAKRSDYVQNIVDEVQTPKENHTMSMSKEQIAMEVQNLLQEEPTQGQPEPLRSQFVASASIPEEETVQTIAPSIPAYQEPQPSSDVNMTMDILPFGPRDGADMSKKSMQERAAIKPQQPEPQTPLAEQTKEAQVPSEKKRPFVSRKPKPTVVPTKEEQMEMEREKKLQQKLVEETQQLRVQLNEYEDDLNDLSEGVEKTNKMLNIILGCLILALLVIIGIIVFWIVQAGGLV